MMNLLKIYGLEDKISAVNAAYAAAKAPKPAAPAPAPVPKATAEIRPLTIKVYSVKSNHFNWEVPSLTVLPRPTAELDLPVGATHSMGGVQLDAGPAWVEVTGPDGERLGRVGRTGSAYFEVEDRVLVVKVW